MRPTVVLFDIDGTLVVTGGAGRRAMASAFDELYRRPDALDGVPLGGMTDFSIVRRGLENVGATADVDAIEQLLAHYLEHLPAEIAASAGYRVMPGVHDAVELALAEGFAVGLGTGNVRRGATIKLSRGGLDGAFAFGGFGCDHEDRVELLRAGLRRGAENLGVHEDACRLVVIGDTHRDVAAAMALGAECIGVGTGGVAPARLLELGARSAFDDLTCRGVREAIRGAA